MVLFTFDPASGNHDEPAVVVVVMRVVDAHGYLSDSHHLLHGHKDEFHRQEADTLVKEVQGTEENQVPSGRECQASGGEILGALGGEVISFLRAWLRTGLRNRAVPSGPLWRLCCWIPVPPASHLSGEWVTPALWLCSPTPGQPGNAYQTAEASRTLELLLK